jgi:hypothetical protein
VPKRTVALHTTLPKASAQHRRAFQKSAFVLSLCSTEKPAFSTRQSAFGTRLQPTSTAGSFGYAQDGNTFHHPFDFAQDANGNSKGKTPARLQTPQPPHRLPAAVLYTCAG